MLIMNNLPVGYFRDLQIIKEVFLPAFDELKDCLQMAAYIINKMEVNEHILDDPRYDPMFSVEEVNQLAANGMPFRDAYKKVGLEIEAGEFKPQQGHSPYSRGKHRQSLQRQDSGTDGENPLRVPLRAHGECRKEFSEIKTEKGSCMKNSRYKKYIYNEGEEHGWNSYALNFRSVRCGKQHQHHNTLASLSSEPNTILDCSIDTALSGPGSYTMVSARK